MKENQSETGLSLEARDWALFSSLQKMSAPAAAVPAAAAAAAAAPKVAKVAKASKGVKKGKKAGKVRKFTLDCAAPVEQSIFDVAAFVSHLLRPLSPALLSISWNS